MSDHNSARATRHKRGYRACDGCKARRVKCDLGSIDDPHDPPCRRCRRTATSCVFTAPTKRRRLNTPPDTSPSDIRSTPRDHDQPPAAVGSQDARQDEVEVDPCLPPGTSHQHIATMLKRPVTTAYDTFSTFYRTRPSAGHDTTVQSSSEVRIDGAIDQSKADPDPIWTEFIFVQNGLLSASQAVDLVGYFSSNILPFTPILSSDLTAPSSHRRMLQEEPIMTLTILMIACRYMPFRGSGSVTRQHDLYHSLWDHLQKLLNHMVWGQESFFGLFSGPGHLEPGHGQRFSDASHRLCPPLGDLRTLGTCEALMLLTEWSPRQIYCAVPEQGLTILSPAAQMMMTRPKTSSEGSNFRLKEVDPLWRSERLIWSTLGVAHTLAIELGVFDESSGHTQGTREKRPEVWKDREYRERASRIAILLPVYLTQTSIRLGRSFLFPWQAGNADTQDDALRCWDNVAALSRKSNRWLYRSIAHTASILTDGSYSSHLSQFRDLFESFKSDLDRAKLSKPMRQILSIEYNHVSVSANSIVFGSLVEKYERAALITDCDATESAVLAASDLVEPFTSECRLSATRTLRIVADELSQDGTLKYLPIRSYHCVFSSAVALWKCCALRPTMEHWSSSLDLLARVSSVLHTCVVDDIHLANHIGRSIEVLVKILKDSTPNVAGSDTKNGYLSLFLERSKKRRGALPGNPASRRKRGHESNGARGLQSEQQTGGGAAYQDAAGSLADLIEPDTTEGHEPLYQDSWLWPFGVDHYDILSYSMPELDTWE